MSSIRYRTLASLFPDQSRTTLWRWRRAGKIGKPDLVVGNRELYREDKFAPCADAAHEQREQANEAGEKTTAG